jgi:dihydroflavonol-4-reductase
MDTSANKDIVLVTGAGGMLGSHIVQILVQSGYRVKAMLYPNSPANDLSDLPIEYYYGDIRNPAMCAEVVSGCTMVIHTAASVSMWPTRSKTIWDINLTGTQNLVAAAQNTNVRRFVHISSASCYGPGVNGGGLRKKPHSGAAGTNWIMWIPNTPRTGLCKKRRLNRVFRQ